MNQLSNSFTLFLSLIVEAFPFLLMGVVLSSILLIWIDEAELIQSLPKNPVLGALTGSLIGFVFPVCECGNVPVARRLILQQVPISVTIGFLLAAPTINPIVIWSTWVAFRDQPEIVGLRILFSLLVAVIISCIFAFQKNITVILKPALTNQINHSSKKNQFQLLQSGTFLLNKGTRPVSLEKAPKTTKKKLYPPIYGYNCLLTI